MTYLLIIFIYGLAIGSFLNVLIDRLPKDEQVIKERSYCDNCKHKLNWLDLVPVFSFLFLKGKCQYCHKKISFYYPLVELITAITFLLIFILIPYSLIIKILVMIIASCLIVIFFSDLKYSIIPDQMIISGLVIALTLLFFLSVNLKIPIYQLLSTNILVSLSAGLFFMTLFLITKGKGMGFGDVKLALLMGFLLGWPKTLIAIYVAFLTGALSGVILILGRRKKFGQTIPFGPFMILGIIIAVVFSKVIINWWLRLF